MIANLHSYRIEDAWAIAFLRQRIYGIKIDRKIRSRLMSMNDIRLMELTKFCEM